MSEADEGEIARRAYQRYQERGGGEGRELDDWFAAKTDLGKERKQPAASDDERKK